VNLRATFKGIGMWGSLSISSVHVNLSGDTSVHPREPQGAPYRGTRD